MGDRAAGRLPQVGGLMGFLSFKVKGRHPQQIAHALPGAAGQATEATAADLLATVQRRTHVITGRTRASWVVEMHSPTDGTLHGEFGAVFEEYGTRFRPPHPTAGPAVEEVRPRARQRLAAALEGTF